MYLEIIEKYYKPGSLAHSIYLQHCRAVTDFALKIAHAHPELNADVEVLACSGMLHDIGIILTDAPEFGCFGKLPYVAHGYKGRELLEKEGLPHIAPVCERHIGVGITLEEIKKKGLPLPHREMVPVAIEEKIICYADKFFSKSAKELSTPKPLEKIRKSLSKHGPEKWARFLEMMQMFYIESGRGGSGRL
jgi:uncharacterized protein